LVVVAVLAVGFFVGQWAGQADLSVMGDRLSREVRQAAEQRDAIDALRESNPQLQAERERRDGERLLEFATRQNLERSVKQQEGEIARLREQLTVYEQLLPTGPQGTITVRGMEVSRQANALRYRVLLMRSGNVDNGSFDGSLSFVAEGVRGGQQETLSLSPLTGSPLANEGDESDLEIAFDRYQRVQGLLAIPEGFEPHTITLNVQEGNVVRASRSVKPGL